MHVIGFIVLICANFYDGASGNVFELPDERVVGGAPAAEGSVPYQASMRNEDNRHYCGGVILSDQWILTAAHCVRAILPTYIVVGTIKRTKGGDKYKVEGAVSHPNYDSRNITNDIALVKLKDKIVFNDKVKSIALPSNDTLEGADLMLSGWGKTSHPGSLPEDLQYINLVSLGYKDCQSKLSEFNEVTEKQICTFTKIGEGACHGDSGGPLVTAEKEEVVGIVSWGFPCARGFPDVFTRVYSYNDWIESTMSKGIVDSETEDYS